MTRCAPTALFDTELGSDNVYAWAKEQAGEVSREMFGSWMYRTSFPRKPPPKGLASIAAW